jgi:hypothetical protein
MWSKIPEKFSISGKEKEKSSAGSCHSSLYTVIHNIFLFFIIVAVRFRAFVGGDGRFVGEVGVFVGEVGVRSTGFGRNRVLRDRNLFILLGFEGAKCRICRIFGTSRETGTGARIKKLHPPGWRMQRIFIGDGCLVYIYTVNYDVKFLLAH